MPLDFKKVFMHTSAENVHYYDEYRKSAEDVHLQLAGGDQQGLLKVLSDTVVTVVAQCCEAFNCVLDG